MQGRYASSKAGYMQAAKRHLMRHLPAVEDLSVKGVRMGVANFFLALGRGKFIFGINTYRLINKKFATPIAHKPPKNAHKPPKPNAHKPPKTTPTNLPKL